ncbi:hypothetical protein N5J23_15040 [Comamonas aquatica]|uniref:Uncharacterized protein n=1 Tax=Comamonas aquatica TaxID=225991 RepID=A0AA42W635_9BURK|nr:hypothetical protein [Comamonas aquatica]MDH1428156.1 hypothetical protein [Comamonas aquatica]MDH1607110.1 hypothetical protein [Comamonas aquatica]MDH1618864.1 hypothetical protein [Comamonas aquatica]MDH2006844.1 hypothetical protein [Comamonas aquatica]
MKNADQSSPLKPVFAALSRHSDLVEIALREPVGMDGDAAVSDPGIRSLREFNVLRSAGERGYRLHSKLRDFANDVLQIHPAYQSLTSIGQLVEQIPMVWRELDDLRSASDYQQADEAIAQIEQDAFDISDLVERNLRLLGLLLSTRFGNVSSLAAKASQNRYYQRQSELMANDLTRLSRAVEKVEGEARERGLQSLAAMLRNTIQAQLPRWTQTLSQHQSQIRRDIFSLREIERKNVLLARTAMLLRQNPGWRGIEEPKLDDEIAPFFMSKPFVGAPLAPIRMHMDPHDEDRSMKDLMRDEVRSLPKLTATPTPAKKPAPIKRADPKEPRAAPEKPAMQALARLAAAAIRNAKEGNKPLSVMDWRIGDTFARGMAPALWLAFTASALRPYKFRVVRVADPAAQGERFSHTFSDALVMPTPDAIALFVRTLGRQLREPKPQGKPAADQATTVP